MKHLFLLALIISVLNYESWACTCGERETPTIALANSNAVFIGKVINAELDTLDIPGFGELYRITFLVSAYWKGIDNDTIILRTAYDGTACGYPFYQDGSYLVYALNLEFGLFTSSCSRTIDSFNMSDDIVEIGNPIPLEASFEGENETKSFSNFTLNQNYPNPFNSSTIFNYFLPKSDYVILKVYSVLGEEIATVVNGLQSGGNKSVTFDATNLASGVYVYRLFTSTYSETKKMIYLR
ncbi:MAG: T9SS type A sorting domain-containing protein [Ignavibacteriae bacterium]|nr:T9SS type A sorting domain-containing protein [Ignavibacteriota bacterium]